MDSKSYFDQKTRKGYMKLAQDEEEKQPFLPKKPKEEDKSKWSFGPKKDGYKKLK